MEKLKFWIKMKTRQRSVNSESRTTDQLFTPVDFGSQQKEEKILQYFQIAGVGIFLFLFQLHLLRLDRKRKKKERFVHPLQGLNQQNGL